ncbi:MAG: LLM class flavin-dependent oxidoreductase [Bacillota bacterium]
MQNAHDIELFSTCPPAPAGADAGYVRRVIEVAQWSERAGCRGILVYSDNLQYDPWLIANFIIEHTASLCPLVAVQPVYAHPYTVAKTIASIANLRGRRVYLNMVAGGFKNDLTALGDETAHDRRYARLMEYTNIIKQLLSGAGPVSLKGEFYRIENLKLAPACPPDLFPGVFMSGSSEAGMAAARELGATAIEYPKPVQDYAGQADGGIESGIRIGIISRERSDAAWEAAHARFPEDRQGQLAHQLAMRVTDSVWHKQLSGLAAYKGETPYWLVPFENYKTMCPYLVGSYREVGEELAGYIAHGYRTFITDVPQVPEELDHIGQAFHNALEQANGATPA